MPCTKHQGLAIWVWSSMHRVQHQLQACKAGPDNNTTNSKDSNFKKFQALSSKCSTHIISCDSHYSSKRWSTGTIVILQLRKQAQRGCVLSCVRLFATSRTVAQQALLSMGFFRQEHWCGLPFPSLGDYHDPGIEPASLAPLGLAGGFFTASTTSKRLRLSQFFHSHMLKSDGFESR